MSIKNLVIEWRYKPTLAVYSAMDRVGLEFGDYFPNWQRSSLSLELHNRERHHRLVLHHNRAVYQSVSSQSVSSAEELEVAHRVFGHFARLIDMDEIQRLGVRQWFVFPRSLSFLELSQLVQQRLHNPDDNLSRLWGGIPQDVAFFLRIKDDQGWDSNLFVGPMSREEWREKIPISETLFAGEAAKESYYESIPDVCLVVDIDASRMDIALTEALTFFQLMRERTEKLAIALNNHIK